MTEQAPDIARTYLTHSGFTLKITPLSPYYMDIIDALYPDKDYPKRHFKNMFGDEFEMRYEPTDAIPDTDDDDYLLWMEWHAVDQWNQEQQRKRRGKREDFLLSMCVEVVDGPISIESLEWRQNLEAPFQDVGFKVPSHPGALRLMFLKFVVITIPQEKSDMVRLAVYEEVDMQGIFNALHGFQNNMG